MHEEQDKGACNQNEGVIDTQGEIKCRCLEKEAMMRYDQVEIIYNTHNHRKSQNKNKTRDETK